MVEISLRPPLTPVIAMNSPSGKLTSTWGDRLTTTFSAGYNNKSGNDNDTFNLTLDMGLLADLWNYEYGQELVRVPPGEFRDVRLTVRSPKDNLPTPRSVQTSSS